MRNRMCNLSTRCRQPFWDAYVRDGFESRSEEVDKRLHLCRWARPARKYGMDLHRLQHIGVTTRLAPRRTLSWTNRERWIQRRPSFYAAWPEADFSSLKGLKLVGSVGSVRQE